ncbi:MAG: tyrosine-type recombinase/integrase [Oscillospiraceae bacterium]|nr:tyrosine-type recombinase/integrase [Oscillospiraceae bacterium]
MAKAKDVGVFKQDNGLWAYRFTIQIDGQKISRRKSTDEYGNKLHTKKEAIKAREAAIAQAHLDRERKSKIVRRTVKEVYKEFCANGRSDRAYRTIQKQDSLWNNHLCEKFGKRFVDDISVAEINDYLAELYHKQEYSYQYVEGFLKMFYLIFGQAYSRNYLDVDTYNKLCVNKDTKIRMPKMKNDDDTDIVAFSREQLAVLDEYFKGTNAETAYLLGRYCGLRINECFGLKWDHVDLEAGTITIDRQMQYQEGLIKLVPVKTRKGNRTVYLNDKLKVYFQELARRRSEDEVAFASLREQKQRFIDDLDGSKISSTKLVNCLPNGTIQTVNSFKYPTREIKSKFGIDFKYHYLRHTYGTMMAELNTPQHLLCAQMGHGYIHVTQRYYLAVTKSGVDALRDNINRL